MIEFSLKQIQANSPYDITLAENKFVFCTDWGIRYVASFDEENFEFGGCRQ